ncbi:MAG: type I methionyl aminopeptidase [Syntrophomonadaceae bacterium]|nr:type I methionyl aminopeptidase [Syntrophomonadaceae bacterium]
MIVIKTKRDIEMMRQAGIIVADTLDKLRDLVKPGVTTQALDRFAENYITDQGARPAFKGYNGFPASVCASINEEVVHGIPGQRRLKEGDIIGLDLGAILNGWVGDSAITVPIGEIDPELKRLLEVTEESLYRGIAEARVGARLGNISHAIQSYVEAAGFSVVRQYVGHGIGRNMHEDPPVPNYGRSDHGPILAEGMTLAIEPMVNAGGYEVLVKPDNWTVVTKDGSYSAHFEHTVAITSTEPVILTRK